MNLPHVIDDNPGVTVYGLATYYDRLIIAHQPHDGSPGFIEPYDILADSSAVLTTLQSQETIRNVPGLFRIADIVTRKDCSDSCHVYIADSSDVIHVFDLLTGQKMSQWSVGNRPRGLSVNGDDNIVITCSNSEGNENCVLEYDGRSLDGRLTRRINLPKDMNNSWHSIQLTTDRFVVCHGGLLHRVCVLECSTSHTAPSGAGDAFLECNACIKYSYGGTQGSAIGQLLNRPRHLAVDKHGRIFVADCDNDRIVILSCCLTFQGVIDTSLNVDHPYRIHLDESRDRLLIGEWSGRVLMLKFSDCLKQSLIDV